MQKKGEHKFITHQPNVYRLFPAFTVKNKFI